MYFRGAQNVSLLLVCNTLLHPTNTYCAHIHAYTQTDTIALNSIVVLTNQSQNPQKCQHTLSFPSGPGFSFSTSVSDNNAHYISSTFLHVFLIFQPQRLSSRCRQWYAIFRGRRNERGHVGVREEEKWTGYRCALHARVCRFSHVQFGLGGWSLQWLNPEAWR